MKYLLFIIVVFVFSQCTVQPVGANVPKEGYLVFTANDPLITCSNTNIQHFITVASQDGSYTMIDKSQYTTDVFDVYSGSQAGFSISNGNQCNNITVELFVDGVMVDSKSYNLGVVCNATTYTLCPDGGGVSSSLDVP